MKTVIIDFHSDYICPWCYIGKARLEKVIENLSDEIEVVVNMKPHLLYPYIPKGGLPKSHFARKHVLNGVGGTKPGMGRSLKREAVKEGLKINYKYIDIIPNSLEAHRMTWMIEDSNIKYDFAKKLFHGYFEEGGNIEDHEYLARQARDAGVSEKVINSFLDSNSGEQEVAQSIHASKEEFITLVPSLNLNSQFMVPGLQEIDVWEKYLRRAVKVSTNSI